MNHLHPVQRSLHPAEISRMRYVPKVTCAKCGKPVEVVKEYRPKTETRHLLAMCHGEREEVEFATGPDEAVTAFGATAEPK